MTNVPIRSVIIESNFVALAVDLAGLMLPVHVSFEGEILLRKAEFHVTLIGDGHGFVEKLAHAKGISIDDAKSKSVEMFRQAMLGVACTVTLQETFFKVVRSYAGANPHTRKSIIAACLVDGARKFYVKLSEMSGVTFTMVPYHITLYTRNDYFGKKGIGLVNFTEFSTYATVIKNAKSELLKLR